jgi:hypothetical protein
MSQEENPGKGPFVSKIAENFENDWFFAKMTNAPTMPS